MIGVFITRDGLVATAKVPEDYGVGDRIRRAAKPRFHGMSAFGKEKLVTDSERQYELLYVYKDELVLLKEV